MQILALNAGSNSLKFEFVQAPPLDESSMPWGESLLSGSFDNIGKKNCVFNLFKDLKPIHSDSSTALNYGDAAQLLFDWVDAGRGTSYGVISLKSIDRVGHRVVHGADCFSSTVAITREVIDQITALEELAPLHNQPAHQVIDVALKAMGTDTPMFAVFDTVFHRDIPDEAARYPLPLKISERHQIRRYGFHGISHQYLAMRMAERFGRPLNELKLITLHLEGGSSAAAIRDGHSIDTSMGFTPLEGLMMGTRSGDLDPSIVLYLIRKEGWDSARTEHFLNKECGLLGVSGLSADTRELIPHSAEPDVNLALNIFCYRVRKYIGAYWAALEGADAIVFGGGIGENTPLIRERIAAGLQCFGTRIDAARNADTIDREGCISTSDSALPLWVIPTQEGLMIAHHVARA